MLRQLPEAVARVVSFHSVKDTYLLRVAAVVEMKMLSS